MSQADLKSLVTKVSTASLTDAIGRVVPHECQILDLKSPNPEQILFGEVAIINYLPYRKDQFSEKENNFASLFYRSMGDSLNNKVLVLGSSGLHDASLGGGTKLSRLHNHKCAGVLAEGRLRDFHELKEYSFATYCHGETARWGGDKLMPAMVNAPISFKGISIYPGDYIYAQRDIAVVIPGQKVNEVFQEALSIEQADAKFIASIKAEDPKKILESGSQET